MGRRKKQKDNTPQHLTTTISIKNGNICAKCPMRLYTQQEYVSFGIGNIESNYIFVLPEKNYSLNDLLGPIFKDITGKDMLSEVYVTYLIKCDNSNDADINKAAIKTCNTFLNYELAKLPAKEIILFGNVFKDLIELNIINTYLSQNKNIHTVYNPLVMTYDNEDNKTKFIEQLTKILLL